MKKILYIMGIDWEWIYQRPQILAEKLSQDYEVDVVYPKSILKWKPCVKKNEKIRKHIMWTIPYQEKVYVLNKIVVWFQKFLFKNIDRYDYVWIGYPLYERYIPHDYKGKLIYDCMDNYDALYKDQKRVHHMVQAEKNLVMRSDIIFASAMKLVQKIKSIQPSACVKLVRNAVEIEQTYPIDARKINGKHIKIGYVGTIAEWFDYDLIKKSIELFPNIEYHLVGPTEREENIEGIIYHGPVEHSKLGEMVQEYDFLIMPFVVNDIIEYVDPVKLYEYIAWGKNIISVYYEEIKRFGKYVYFYKQKEEFFSLLEKCCKSELGIKYDEDMRYDFECENTWESRYIIINEQLDCSIY